MRTKHGASRLARQLEKDGLKTTAIHGDKSQPARLEALDDFKAAKVQVMVATDVAARGLDIDDLPLVINYELPYVPEDYIHRIGRTGRAGASGEAISFCSPDEERLLIEIERMLKRSIPVAAADGIPAERAPAHAERTPAPARESRASREPRAVREPRHAREGRPAKPPRERAAETLPPRRDHAVDDTRNPDQPPIERPAVKQNGSGTLAPSPHGRPASRKSHPIPALLMKRTAGEPEKV